LSRDPVASHKPLHDVPKNSRTITLVGAGLTGPLLAISLAQRGFPVQIFERRPDMRLTRLSAGRSINLAVSTRGIHALREAGLWDQMSRIIIPMKGRMMHSLAGELTFQPYGQNDTEVINSISRADLNVALMNAAEAQGVTIHFGERCTGMDSNTGAVRFRNEESGREIAIDSEVMIGTDGSASAIRQDMQKLGRLNSSQEVLDYGYKELTIAAGPGGKHILEPNALHIWPRGAYMLIALPNIDGTFACILFLPFAGRESFVSLDTGEKAQGFFAERFADAVPLMPQLQENYAGNPVGSMVTVKCAPWQLDGKVLLLGDAAHAIVPFFGQGMNCAFEDCTVFLELLDRHGPDWKKLFQEFEQARKPNTDSIADMALENFIEMRDRVADPRFLFRKKVELALEAKYPRHFVPKYAMVTFHRVPYSVAFSRGKIQDRLLAELCDPIARIEDLDWKKADHLIHRELIPMEAL
jgi:kynurenine 3-monooxygenase